MGWNKVTKLKKVGGLRLQSAKGRNIALLTKLNWRFHIEKESLWARVIKAKYYSTRRINSRNSSSLPCSQTWKGIKKGTDLFQHGSRWVIGRESNLSFWYDNWTQMGPLRQLIQGPLPMRGGRMESKGHSLHWGMELGYCTISHSPGHKNGDSSHSLCARC